MDSTESIGRKQLCTDKLMLTRSDRVAEAEHEYKELKADSEEATRRFETIVRLMNEEIVRFQEQIKDNLGSIADALRSLLPKLESCSPAQ